MKKSKAKKTLSLVLALTLVLLAMPLSAFSSFAFLSGDWDYDLDGNNAVIYFYNGSDSDLVIPNEIDGHPVTALGENAFGCNYNLISVTIPNSVTTIMANAFSCCYNLSSVYLPLSVTDIYDDAFACCYALTNVYYEGDFLDKANINIGYYNEDLEDATWAYSYVFNTVIRCGDNAYATLENDTITISGTGDMYDYDHPYDDTNTSPFAFNALNARALVIGEGITSVGDYEFYGCNSITSVTLPSTLTRIGDYGLEDIRMASVTLPNGLTEIGENAFQFCFSLTSIVIPDTVTSIGEQAFSDCGALESVVMSRNVSTLKLGTFSCCYGLRTIYLGKNTTAVNLAAFQQTTGITDVYYAGSEAYRNANMSIDSSNGFNDGLINATWHYNSYIEYRYIVKPDGTAEITGIVDSCSDIEIPSVYSGYTVTSIGRGAFSRNTDLETVSLPDTLTEIGNGAFYDCYNLESINIPEGVTRIGRSAFFGCESLGDIFIPASVVEIIPDAFYGCYNIDTITGYLDTAAQDYAEANGFNFVYLDVITKGDFNIDGTVDILDIGGIMSASTDMIKINNKQRLSGDYNNDGVVDAFDASAVDRVVA